MLFRSLTCIDVDSDNVEVFGQKIIGLTQRDIELLMKKNKIFDITKEEEDWGETRISFEDYSVDFYFIDNELASITFGK